MSESFIREECLKLGFNEADFARDRHYQGDIWKNVEQRLMFRENEPAKRELYHDLKKNLRPELLNNAVIRFMLDKLESLRQARHIQSYDIPVPDSDQPLQATLDEMEKNVLRPRERGMQSGITAEELAVRLKVQGFTHPELNQPYVFDFMIAKRDEIGSQFPVIHTIDYTDAAGQSQTVAATLAEINDNLKNYLTMRSIENEYPDLASGTEGRHTASEITRAGLKGNVQHR